MLRNIASATQTFVEARDNFVARRYRASSLMVLLASFVSHLHLRRVCDEEADGAASW